MLLQYLSTTSGVLRKLKWRPYARGCHGQYDLSLHKSCTLSPLAVFTNWGTEGASSPPSPLVEVHLGEPNVKAGCHLPLVLSSAEVLSLTDLVSSHRSYTSVFYLGNPRFGLHPDDEGTRWSFAGVAPS